MSGGTHLLVVKSELAMKCLEEEHFLIAAISKCGDLLMGGDAMVARDFLVESGFQWGRDFYIRKMEAAE